MITGKRIYMAGSGGMLGEAFHKVYGGENELRCTDKDVNAARPRRARSNSARP